MQRTVVVIEEGAWRYETVSELEDLQKLVGGYIEAVNVSEHFTVWVNEEGMLRHLRPTIMAPEIGAILVGPVVIDGIPDEEGEAQVLDVKACYEANKWMVPRLLDAADNLPLFLPQDGVAHD